MTVTRKRVIEVGSLYTDGGPPFPFVQRQQFLIFDQVDCDPQLSDTSTDSSSYFEVDADENATRTIAPP